ncbi:MAG: AAA family ATPase [Lachnospiraceae bacterium]|nr:AAA family ATPase [Lachnospiraceae bacterium]
MRLISCHIENFGRLHDYTLEFGPEKTEILAENGWGKSTLASFLRVMFYGLSGDKKRDLSNERVRFAPWQGGVFGGELVFESGGKTYRAVRVFRDRAANDLFELYDESTGLRSADFSQDLGKELFRIDRESFARTALIGQDDISTAATDDVNSLIARLTGQTGDLERFEEADAALKKTLDHMNPDSVRGSLARQQSELLSMKTRIRNGEGIEANLRRAEDALQDLEARARREKTALKAAEELEDRAAAVQMLMAKKAEYSRTERVYREKAEAYRKAKEAFPVRVPEKEELEGLAEISASIGTDAREYQDSKLTDAEAAEYASLNAAFPETLPEDTAFSEAFRAARRLAALDDEIRVRCLSRDEKDALRALGEEFGENAPAGDAGSASRAETPSEMMALYGSIQGSRQRLEVKKAELERMDEHFEKAASGMRRGMILLLAAAGCLVLAVLLFLLFGQGTASADIEDAVRLVVSGSGMPPWSYMVPLALFVILVAAGLIVFFKYFPAGNRQAEAGLVEASDAVRELYDAVRQDEEKLGGYLERHGETVRLPEDAEERRTGSGRTGRVLRALSGIQRRYTLYEQLREKDESVREDALFERKAELSEQLDAFLAIGQMTAEDGEYTDSLYLLRERANRCRYLRARRARADRAKDAVLDKRTELSVFLEGLGLLDGSRNAPKIMEMQSLLASLPEKRSVLLLTRNAMEEALTERSRFVASNDMDEILKETDTTGIPTPEEAREAVRACRARAEALQAELLNGSRQAELLREQYEAWLDLKEQEGDAADAYNRALTRYETVLRARTFLTEARDRLTGAYTAPILEGFRKYYGLLSGDSGEQFSMDVRSRISYRAEGLPRDTQTCSRGYRDLVGLCLRFALLDAMYPDEKPPVILDDPFANLDTEKLSHAGAFTDAVSKEYQIVYFTCHESRTAAAEGAAAVS